VRGETRRESSVWGITQRNCLSTHPGLWTLKKVCEGQGTEEGPIEKKKSTTKEEEGKRGGETTSKSRGGDILMRKMGGEMLVLPST